MQTVNASIESLRSDMTRTTTEDFNNAPDTMLASSSDQAALIVNTPPSHDNLTRTSSTAPIVDDDDEQQRPRENSEGRPKTSLGSTFINLMKAGVGTGILAMPDAVKNGGLAVGTGGILFLGFLTTYCSHQLLHAYVQVSDGKSMSFSDVTKLAFRRAGSRASKFARPSKFIVDSFLVLTQLGNCCVYILAVARMVREVFDYALPTLGWDIRIYETLILAILIPSCFVTTLKLLSYVALFANVIQATSLIVILQYVFRNVTAIENLDLVPPSFSTAPLFFGTAMFAFNLIPFLLPMETCMADRKSFHRWNGLLSLGMCIIVVLHAAVGFYGYLAFGTGAKMILSNLPTDDWLYNVVKLMMAVAIFLSYNLQLYVPVEILFPPLKRRVNKGWFDRFGEYAFRTALVLLTYGLAVSIPCLELMISLFGSLTAGSLNLVVPPLIELLCCFHQNGKQSWFTYIKCGVMMTFGIFGCVVGSLVAIQEMAAAMASPNGCGN